MPRRHCHGRGHRDQRAGRRAHRPRMPQRPGLLLRPPSAPGGDDPPAGRIRAPRPRRRLTPGLSRPRRGPLLSSSPSLERPRPNGHERVTRPILERSDSLEPLQVSRTRVQTGAYGSRPKTWRGVGARSCHTLLASLATMITRAVPERLLLPMVGRTTRGIGYRAAAWLYRLDGIDELEPEFAIPHGTWRRGPFDHQRRRIDDLEFAEIDGVLVTSVRQTLVDLCAVVDLDIVERAAESALRRRLVDELALRDFADTWALNRHGAPGLRDVLRRRSHGEPPTGSDLETQCVQVWRRGRVPRPQRQWPVIDRDGQLVAITDFGFYPRLFVVENDGLATHG